MVKHQHRSIQPAQVTDLDQDVVEADHKKADDAKVPVHLWNFMFMKAWGADKKV